MVRRRICRAVLVVALAAGAFGDEAGESAGWRRLKRRHFVVRYAGGRDYARRVLSAAEESYDRVAGDLGFTRHDGFWLWDDRCRIAVYASHEAFRRASGSPAWAAGRARHEPGERSVATFQGSETFIRSVLPHELTHLVFRDFLGETGSAPLWFHEGLAQWQEPAKRRAPDPAVRAMQRWGRLIPVASLMEMDGAALRDTGVVYAFYRQSLSLVRFLMNELGPDRFRRLCGHLRDGRSMEAALRLSSRGRIGNIKELEEAWHGYLEETR